MSSSTTADTGRVGEAPASPSHPHHHTGHHVRSKKSGSDPFLELPDDMVALPDQPVRNSHDGKSSDTSDGSLFVDLVITPISMISFLVSLFLVDRQQRQWRLSQHPTAASQHPPSYYSRLTHWPWLSPEPYQEQRDTAWQQDGSAAAQRPPAHDFQGWYTRKKHRAMARLEISDAFDMKGRVIVALLVWISLSLTAAVLLARRTYLWLAGI